MAEYIEREALLEKAEEIEWWNETTGFYDHIRIVHAYDVEDAPAADVVEVVRCKDCQHARQTVYGNYHCLVDHRLAHEETDYCSYGERKEGAEE